MGTSSLQIGAVLRTMGESSQPSVLAGCARAAEASGIDALWLPDHVAIPPDQAEGSEGRYLDVLATLAYLAAATKDVMIGSAVLILPYRPALLTARWVATIQELSGGRLQLGVGVGWMDSEFRALGLRRSQRAALCDQSLEFLHHCFEAPDDIAMANDQAFLFRPHPPRPPILVGGAAPHALARAARHGDGWFPMQNAPVKLAPAIAELRERFAEAGKPAPQVVCFTGVSAEDPAASAAHLQALGDVGVTGVAIGGSRYASVDEYRSMLDTITRVRSEL